MALIATNITATATLELTSGLVFVDFTLDATGNVVVDFRTRSSITLNQADADALHLIQQRLRQLGDIPAAVAAGGLPG